MTKMKCVTVGLIACIAALCLALVGCSGSSSSSAASSSASSASSSASAAPASDSASAGSGSAASAPAASEPASPSAASASAESAAASSSASASAPAPAALIVPDELSGQPDVTIALDDFDAMFELAKSIQNGEKEGAIVQIDGYVKNFAKGMSYSIVENNPEGNKSEGTVFVIEDLDEDSYPSDGTHVILTGKVVKNDAASWNIHTLGAYVQVVE